MRKQLLLLSFLFICTFSYSQNWLWGVEGSSSSDSWGTAIDNTNNVYLAGYFGDPWTDTMEFGNKYVITVGQDAFLAKFNPNGNVVFVTQSKSVTRASYCQGVSISSDIQGDIYYTGYFFDTVCFGADTLGKGTYQIYTVFLTKYDSNGNVLWAKQSKSPSMSSGGQGMTVATDKSKNAFVVGFFADTISFGSITLKTQNIHDSAIFLVKYDSNGNVLWAKQSIDAGGYLDLYLGPYSITTDDSGNAYIAGSFKKKVQFGLFTLTSISTTLGDAFLAKYDKNGNVRWVVQSNSLSSSAFCIGYGIIADAAGNIYLTGSISNNVDIGPYTLKGPPVVLAYGNLYGDLFFTKYNPDGKVIWAKQGYSDSGGWCGFSLAKDDKNQIYLSGGNFIYATYLPQDMMVYDKDTFKTTKYTGDASILFKLDTAGNLLCGTLILAGGDDNNTVVCSPSGQYVYLGGDLWDTITLGNDFLSLGSETPFIARWQNCDVTAQVENLITPKIENITLFPNPNNGIFTIQANDNQSIANNQVEIYNMLGEKVYSELIIDNSQLTINLSSQPSGVYLCRILKMNGEPLSQGKIIIQK